MFVLVAVGALIAVPAVVLASSVKEGESELESIGGSGIEAEIDFVDNGSTLTIHGEAEGLDPDKTYVSLIYDVDSPVTGPLACEPAIFAPGDPNNILDTMFIGFWDVDEDGDGTLSETNIFDDVTLGRVYVPLSKIGTVSIRLFQDPDFPVQACGKVEVDDDDDEDDDESDDD